jgi:hypothetical protein
MRHPDGTPIFPKLVELSLQVGSLNEKRDVFHVVSTSSTTTEETYTLIFPTEADTSAAFVWPTKTESSPVLVSLTETDTRPVFVWPSTSTVRVTPTVTSAKHTVTTTTTPTQRDGEEGHETATST